MTIGMILSMLAGISLGLLGGGGSILMVPILLYVVGLNAHEAIAVSLFVVGTTSAVGFSRHAAHGNVAWLKGLMITVGGMIGAFLGGRIGGLLPGGILLLLFAGMMGLTATAMLRARRDSEDGRQAHLLLLLPVGLLVGGFTGMVGAGGGFLVVPALVFLAGLPIRQAVGTSLLVISMQSLSGLLGYLSHLDLPWKIAFAVCTAAIAGSFIGVGLSRRVRPDHLRRGFGVFVLLMAIFVLIQELPGVLA